eukprot:Skav215291  [mRNA]  locus=scaffold2522:218059:220614:- [translate_table: standard]
MQAAAQQRQSMPRNITWVDDTAIAVFASSEALCGCVLHTLSIVLDVFTEYGFQLSFGPGKTAVMLSFHGSKAHVARQTAERTHGTGFKVLSEHLGCVKVPWVSHYKHLGGIIVRTGSVLPEIRIRAAQAAVHLKPLRRLLSSPNLDLRKRQRLLHSLGLSVMSLHSGAWGTLSVGEFRAWQAALTNLYRMLQPPAQTQQDHHRSIYQLAVDAHAPLPLEYLHLQRIRLLVHILQVQDPHLHDAIFLNFAIAGPNSWLCAAQKSVVWWASQVGVESLPTAIFHLEDEASWAALQPDIRPMKKAIKQAQQGHLMRLENLLTLQRHAAQQDDILRDMGWTGPMTSSATATEPAEHVCATCQATFATAAALAVHETHKHQKRIAMRRFAPDCVCRGCHRWYHTRPRLLQHLHQGSTNCWVRLLRTYQPLTEPATQALDHLDRDAKVAQHQRGVKSHEVDRAWRPATEPECAGGLAPLDGEIFVDDDDPTVTELAEWSTYGLLPPGRGGRARTQRRLDEVDVPNADAHLTHLEQTWKTACREWHPDFDWIPRPLAEGQKYALLLYSGHRRPGDLASWLWWNSELVPINVDLAVDAVYGNVFDSALWISLIKARKVAVAHAGPPCETFTYARWLPPPPGSLYPRPLRDDWAPWGRLARTVKEIAQFCVGNALMTRGLYLLLLVYLHGGAFTLEHPAPRTHEPTPSSPMPWCIWDSAFIKQLMLAGDINLLTFMQGPLGRPYPKPTCLLHARLPGLAAALFSEYDKTWRPTERLGGRNDAGEWRTAAAKIYPERMCKALALQFAWYARQCPVEGSEDDPVALQAALQALSLHWDPYQMGSHEMCGDYHRTAVPNSFAT